ncbi:MAG TPA: hypothetical protein VF622_17415 [Segetibacter sp.]|jgi:hypothetical protein
MNWTLQPSGNHTTEFELIADDGQKITFKYSRIQQSIRMRFNEHYGVYVLDEGSFIARRFAIRNVYGSEIGAVSKGSWRETSGHLILNELSEKVNYQINTRSSLIEISTGTSIKVQIGLIDKPTEENYLLALIVFSWMQSVSAVHIAGAF